MEGVAVTYDSLCIHCATYRMVNFALLDQLMHYKKKDFSLCN